MSDQSVIRVAHRGTSSQYPENIQQVLKVDVHGFMTDRPDVLYKVLYEITI
jgi:glycerophosphoryl diester phosphodiesterase